MRQISEGCGISGRGTTLVPACRVGVLAHPSLRIPRGGRIRPPYPAPPSRPIKSPPLRCDGISQQPSEKIIARKQKCVAEKLKCVRKSIRFTAHLTFSGSNLICFASKKICFVPKKIRFATNQIFSAPKEICFASKKICSVLELTDSGANSICFVLELAVSGENQFVLPQKRFVQCQNRPRASARAHPTNRQANQAHKNTAGGEEGGNLTGETAAIKDSKRVPVSFPPWLSRWLVTRLRRMLPIQNLREKDVCLFLTKRR
jgi:hypothetical protein